MPRRARVTVPGQPHHVTQRGDRRADVFLCDGDRSRYREFLQQYSERSGLTILACCLVTNHAHLIAVPEAEGSLGVALRAAHARYSQWGNAREEWTGHLWQGRRFSCPLDEAHPWAATRYVEQNPVRAGLAEVAEAYEWSSAAAHCGLRTDPLVTGALPDGVSPGVWQAHLAEPVTEEDAERLRDRTQSGLPCGDEWFLARVSGLVGRPLIVRGRGRPRDAMDEQERGRQGLRLLSRRAPIARSTVRCGVARASVLGLP